MALSTLIWGFSWWHNGLTTTNTNSKCSQADSGFKYPANSFVDSFQNELLNIFWLYSSFSDSLETVTVFATQICSPYLFSFLIWTHPNNFGRFQAKMLNIDWLVPASDLILFYIFTREFLVKRKQALYERTRWLFPQ